MKKQTRQTVISLHAAWCEWGGYKRRMVSSRMVQPSTPVASASSRPSPKSSVHGATMLTNALCTLPPMPLPPGTRPLPLAQRDTAQSYTHRVAAAVGRSSTTCAAGNRRLLTAPAATQLPAPGAMATTASRLTPPASSIGSGSTSTDEFGAQALGHRHRQRPEGCGAALHGTCTGHGTAAGFGKSLVRIGRSGWVRSTLQGDGADSAHIAQPRELRHQHDDAAAQPHASCASSACMHVCMHACVRAPLRVCVRAHALFTNHVEVHKMFL
eukprot:353618-Chlamydomonas_euryale.AAC.11